MSTTTYTYSIASDIVAGKCDLAQLVSEIQNSAIVTALDYDLTKITGDVLDVVFKDALSTGDKTILDNDTTGPSGGLIGAHTGVGLGDSPTPVFIDQTKYTSDKRLRIAVEKGDESRVTLISHRWNDKTTWYENSTRVVEEVTNAITQTINPPGSPSTRDTYICGVGSLLAWLGQDGKIARWNGSSWDFYDTPNGWSGASYKAYLIANDYVIDAYHGKLSDEGILVDASSNSYRVAAEKDTGSGYTAMTEDTPENLDNDFTIDYDLGIIFLNSAITGSDNVRITYHYATNSLFTIAPKAGKKITLEMVEVQFAKNVELNDTAVFQAVGYVDVFAPQLVNNVDPDYVTSFPSGFQIPIDPPKAYKTIHDYINEATRSYPTYPVMGGSSWRGASQEIVIFNWDYTRGIQLFATYGMAVKVYLETDTPFGGDYATSTFYGASEDEDLS
jgi:hypothetical protein